MAITMTLIFVILKLTETIDWAWVWVVSPLGLIVLDHYLAHLFYGE